MNSNNGMPRQPVISVCIANYNGMTVIDDCIQSVLAQQGEFSVEILVHDDASDDESVVHIRDHYPTVAVLESRENVGFCIANNRMVAVARGKYLLLLNNDAALYPDALRLLLAASIQFEEPSILSLPQYDAATGELVDRGCLLDPFFNPVPNIDPERTEVAMVIGACLWIPTVMWHELGGFPEWFGSIAEDMYLCCRARLVGYQVRTLRVSGYRHWQGKSFGGNRVMSNQLVTSFRRRALSERNKSFVMVLTCPAPIVQVIFPFHMGILLLEGAILTLLRCDLRIFRGVYMSSITAVLAKRSFLLGLRREIQNKKTIKWQSYFSVFSLQPQKVKLLLKHGIPHVS